MVNEADTFVVIESDDPALHRAGRELAAELGLDWVVSGDLERAKPRAAMGEKGGFVLAVRDDGLELRNRESRAGTGLTVDFKTLHPKQAARRGGFSRKQPLARAMGKNTKTVLDATAGLGHDAALLACMGLHVTAAERSKVIAALLRDGLRRAMLSDELREALGDRLIVINADARDVLENRAASFDAVYIDPMFPPKRKASALAKKSIRLVRRIVGDDDDAAELVAAARRCVKRVIVKRPTHAPPLGAMPTASIEGKLVRYDIYAR